MSVLKPVNKLVTEPTSSKIDTTVLKIKIKTIGDLKTLENLPIPFHPNMVTMPDLKNNSYILFTDLVKITKKDLENASKSKDDNSNIGKDFKQVFNSVEKFTKLLNYISSTERELDDSLIVAPTNDSLLTSITNNSQDENDQAEDMDASQMLKTITKPGILTPEEIVTNNIGLINSIFFPFKERFFILGREYIIIKSICIFPYAKSADDVEKIDIKIPKSYTVTIKLILADVSTSDEDLTIFGKLNCNTKRESVKRDIQEVLGINMGYNAELDKKPATLFSTSSHTKDRGYGKTVMDWEKIYICQTSPVLSKTSDCRGSTDLNKVIRDNNRLKEQYREIPADWITERENLEQKITLLTQQFIRYKEDINKIKREPEQDSAYIKDKIKKVTEQIKERIKELLKITIQANDNDAENRQIAVTSESLNTQAEEIVTDFLTMQANNEIGGRLKTAIGEYTKQEEDKIDNKHINTFIRQQDIEKKLNNLRRITDDIKKDTEELNKLASSRNATDKYKVSGEEEKKKKNETTLMQIKSELFPILRPLYSVKNTDTKRYEFNPENYKRELLTLTLDKIKEQIKTRWNEYIKDSKVNASKFKEQDERGEIEEYAAGVKAKLVLLKQTITKLRRQLNFKKFLDNDKDLTLFSKADADAFKRESEQEDSSKLNKDISSNKKTEELEDELRATLKKYFKYLSENTNKNNVAVIQKELSNFILNELSNIMNLVKKNAREIRTTYGYETKSDLNPVDKELFEFKIQEYNDLITKLGKNKNINKNKTSEGMTRMLDELKNEIIPQFERLLVLTDVDENEKEIFKYMKKLAENIKKIKDNKWGQITSTVKESVQIILNILKLFKDFTDKEDAVYVKYDKKLKEIIRFYPFTDASPEKSTIDSYLSNDSKETLDAATKMLTTKIYKEIGVPEPNEGLTSRRGGGNLTKKRQGKKKVKKYTKSKSKSKSKSNSKSRGTTGGKKYTRRNSIKRRRNKSKVKKHTIKKYL
jgi:hypothetical protein